MGSTIASMPPCADEQGRVLLEGGPWARLGIDDVCPQCLTASEERALASAYVQLVEAEVERAQAQGSDPQEHEGQLIAYALVLRRRLADSPPRRVSTGERAPRVEVVPRSIHGSIPLGPPVSC